MLQCFVVCPFGSADGSEEDRRLFDQLEGLHSRVFNVAKEVCRQDKLEVQISDSREIAHGCVEVKGAVQKCLDEAAAVIILLSADKPNVYLEMGWAHGLWQAPILLASDTYTVPADINNDLHLRFTAAQIDGRDEPGARRLGERLGREIVGRIRKGRQIKQFGHWPPTTLARGAVHVYNRFSKAISPSDWSAMLDAAKREIIIASTSMSRIRSQAFFVKAADGRQVQTTLEKLLLAKALDGVKVTILLYHEDNVTVGHLKRLKSGLKEVHDELQKSFAVWSTQRRIFDSLAARSGGTPGAYRVIQVRRRHLPFRVTLTERRVLATIRFYTEIYNSGLCVDALCPTEDVDRENTPVYTQIKDELEYIIEDNSETSEQAYQDWLRQVPQAV